MAFFADNAEKNPIYGENDGYLLSFAQSNLN